MSVSYAVSVYCVRSLTSVILCLFLLSRKLAYFFTLHYLIIVFDDMPMYTPIAVVPERESLVWFYLVYWTTTHNVMTSSNGCLVAVLRCTLLWCLGLCQVLVLRSWTYSLICIVIQFEPLIHFTYLLPSWLQRSCGNGAGVYVVSIYHEVMSLLLRVVFLLNSVESNTPTMLVWLGVHYASLPSWQSMSFLVPSVGLFTFFDNHVMFWLVLVVSIIVGRCLAWSHFLIYWPVSSVWFSQLNGSYARYCKVNQK